MFFKTSFTLIGLMFVATLTFAVADDKPTSKQNVQTGKPQGKKRPEFTTIYVEDVHCKHCAKRLARKLFTVPGVKKVRANVKKDIAMVYPETKKVISPLKLWEAAEAAKFKVIKIETPTDVYEEKPVELAETDEGAASGQTGPKSTANKPKQPSSPAKS